MKPNLLLLIIGTAILVILQGIGESAISLLRYENTLIQNGEWWRLLSGHFIHLSWMHLALNIAGLWILFFIFSQIQKPIISLISIIVLAIAISFELLIFSREITWYVGLSGVLHGLIVMGALANIRLDARFAILLLVGVSVKLIWEQLFADAHAMEHAIGGKVIYAAHLYGALTGGLLFATLSFIPSARHGIKK